MSVVDVNTRYVKDKGAFFCRTNFASFVCS